MITINPEYPENAIVKPLETDKEAGEYFFEAYTHSGKAKYKVLSYSLMEANKTALSFCKDNGYTLNKVRSSLKGM